jgi:hypothetical protein
LLNPKSKVGLKAAIEKEAASAGLGDRSEPKEEVASASPAKAPDEAETAEEKKEEPKVAVAVEEKPPTPAPRPEPRAAVKEEEKPPAAKPKPRHKPKTNKRKKRRKKPVATAAVEEKGFGTLDVGVSGGWAFVHIDGAKIRTTPLLNYQIKAGKHKVELRDGEGRVIRRWSIRLRTNERVKLLHQ